MLLIVRHQIVHLAGERLGHDPGVTDIPWLPGAIEVV